MCARVLNLIVMAKNVCVFQNLEFFNLTSLVILQTKANKCAKKMTASELEKPSVNV